jgi:hypothetical protein
MNLHTRPLTTLLLIAVFTLGGRDAFPSPNCANGMCDIFRLSVNAVGNTTSGNTATLPGGPSPNIVVPLDPSAPTLTCSKIVRVPFPVYQAIMKTIARTASRDYLARISEFTPHEQTMLLFFHTLILQARGIGSCGGQ